MTTILVVNEQGAEITGYSFKVLPMGNFSLPAKARISIRFEFSDPPHFKSFFWKCNEEGCYTDVESYEDNAGRKHVIVQLVHSSVEKALEIRLNVLRELGYDVVVESDFRDFMIYFDAIKTRYARLKKLLQIIFG